MMYSTQGTETVVHPDCCWQTRQVLFDVLVFLITDNYMSRLIQQEICIVWPVTGSSELYQITLTVQDDEACNSV